MQGRATNTSYPASSAPGPVIAELPTLISEPVDASTYQSAARLGMLEPRSGMAFWATSPSSHTIVLDTGLDAGGTDAAVHPVELLLIALGSCSGMDVISILRKKRQRVTSYTVNVYGNQANEHPRVYTEILVEHVVEGPGIDPAAVTRSIELSTTRYCPVHAMLSRATRVEHVYRILDSTPGPGTPGGVD